ncbi:enoyl-CoA hydratase/isomerase family protein [Gryllotalpicola daejeonensis]|uniref:3-hydroxyisobutyryl-CoA hydrolase n=1 Tax=Gryllotalpicola daejeonensis TaxID=993087 RepID=A0ABP7ZHH3_9MICO
MSAEAAAQAERDVEFARRGHLAEIALNRPRAINALTHGMVSAIHAALEQWADDDTVQTVVLTGRGDRGLCAGGDIVGLYYDMVDGDGSASEAFWRDEYRLNLYIANYPKPFVAVMDGVTLGGGVGLSAHAAIRVVTERSKVGMPETSIGYIPDVGGTWLLAHAPGELGTYLGLTASTIGAADAILAGFADHYVPSERLSALIEDLETGDADAAVTRHAETPPPGTLGAAREWIDPAFSAPTVAEVVGRLRADGRSEAAATADLIEAKSPTAVSVTLEALRRAAQLPDLAAALEQELRVSVHALTSHDFREGIRAQVIDKDRQPHWQPATLAEVDPSSVATYFAG